MAEVKIILYHDRPASFYEEHVNNLFSAPAWIRVIEATYGFSFFTALNSENESLPDLRARRPAGRAEDRQSAIFRLHGTGLGASPGAGAGRPASAPNTAHCVAGSDRRSGPGSTRRAGTTSLLPSHCDVQRGYVRRGYVPVGHDRKSTIGFVSARNPQGNQGRSDGATEP